MPKLNKVRAIALSERGVIAQGLIILLLLAGIGAGIYLVQHPQIFKPKATSENIDWVTSDNQDPDNCVTVNEKGETITACPKVKFRINVPIEVKQ